MLNMNNDSNKMSPSQHCTHPYPSTSGQSNVEVSTLCDRLHSIKMENHIHVGTDTTNDISPNIDVTGITSDAVTEIKQDIDGDTLLHTAIILQETESAIHYINKATSQDELSNKNNLCQTPLHLAVLTNQTSVARLLIVGGAKIESRDRDGNTALHIACREGSLEIATVLLEPVRFTDTKHNIYDIPFQNIQQNIELSNYVGLNCLHIAALNGHCDLVNLLLKKGANINSKDLKTGRTILHSACFNGNINLVNVLLKYPQCELNAKTYDGYFPFDLARARGNYDIIKELAMAGAQNEDYLEDMEL